MLGRERAALLGATNFHSVCSDVRQFDQPFSVGAALHACGSASDMTISAVCIYVSMYVCMYVFTCLWICFRHDYFCGVYVCIYVCMYVCIYVLVDLLQM